MGLLGACVAFGLPSGALADPGDGIQVGDTTTIQPSVDVGFELRSNSYLSVGERQGEPGDAARFGATFVLQPGLDVRVRHPKVEFAFDGVYQLRKFFQQDLAQNLDQFTNFDVKTGLVVLPKGVVGFTLRDHATLRNRASDNQFADNSLISQFRNDLDGFLNVRPGEQLGIDLGAGWASHTFRVPGSDPRDALNLRNAITPQLNLAWKFFPETSFVVEGSYQLNRWRTNWMSTTGGDTSLAGGEVRSYGDFLAMPDSDLLKVRTGLRGRITRHLSLIVLAGYGMGNYLDASVAEESASDPGRADEADPDAAGFGADVSATDAILATVRADVDVGFDDVRTFGQRVRLMYSKDFEDSFFTNYVHGHYVFAGLQSRWGRMVSSNLNGGVRFENYRGEVDRNDIFLRVGGDVVVAPLDWLDVSTGVNWTQRASTQTEIQFDNVQGQLVLHVEY